MDKLNFKKLSLDDKELFDKYFEEFPPEISEYSFTNLYIWKNSKQIEYALHDEGLIILAKTEKENYFLPPVGFSNLEKIYSFLIEYGNKYGVADKIKRVDEQQLEFIEKLGFNILHDRDNYDYVYSAEDLAFLNGRRYSNKRGFVKKFCSEYYHRYAPYSEECKEACLNLTKKWRESKDSNDYSLDDEYNAIIEFFDNYDKLDATGAVLCVNNNIIAYSFGERLNKDTFVIHLEKADFAYAGVYQSINKFFVENEVLGNFEFVNREQDLGIEGIRKAKKSYSPVRMIRKYTISS